MITKVRSAGRRIWQRANQEPKRLWHWYVLRDKATVPPDLFKQRLVKEIARRFSLKTLIETGTYKGDMVAAVLNSFDTIYSIELHQPFFEAAQERFAAEPKVQIVRGDSTSQLRDLLKGLDQPALFWLDAHGGDSAKVDGVEESAPVLAEVTAILDHSGAGEHVILVDDVHTFRRNVKWGVGVWAEVEQLRQQWLAKHPDWIWQVEDNVLRIYRKRDGE